MEGVRHEAAMRDVRREQLLMGKTLTKSEITNIRVLYTEHGSLAEVRRRTHHNPKTIKKYTADMRGEA